MPSQIHGASRSDPLAPLSIAVAVELSHCFRSDLLLGMNDHVFNPGNRNPQLTLASTVSTFIISESVRLRFWLIQ